MKGVIYEEYGDPDVLELTELERPEPGPGEVRIRVRAVEVTKADCELRRFSFPVKSGEMVLVAAACLRIA